MSLVSTTNASYAYWRPTSSANPSVLSSKTLDAAFNFYQSPSCSPCFCVTNQNCYQPFASNYSGYMIPYCDTNGNCEMLAATAAQIGPYTPFVNSAGQPMPENFFDNYNTGVYLQVVGFGCNGCGALQSKLAQLCSAASTTPMPTTTTPLATD
uniref:Uncharacterized protein n=1 Tax=Acrobeloides nanus TaxID=290746 RepID=A0A914EG38_9BILA